MGKKLKGVFWTIALLFAYVVVIDAGVQGFTGFDLLGFVTFGITMLQRIILGVGAITGAFLLGTLIVKLVK